MPDEDRELGVLDEQEHAELFSRFVFVITVFWFVVNGDETPDEYLLNLTALTINGWLVVLVDSAGLPGSTRLSGMSKNELGRFSPPFNGSAGGIRLSLVVGDKGLFSFVVKIIDGDSGMFGLVLVFEDINKLVGRCIISSLMIIEN